MYKIRERKRHLRINNPVSFGILCAMILVLIVGGVYALAVGVIAPGVQELKQAYATPSPEPTAKPATPTPSATPAPTDTPEPTLEPGSTPTPTPSPDPAQGRLTGKVIGIDPARGYTSKYRGASTGVYANRTNYAVALALKSALEAEGATVVLSYTDVETTPDTAARAGVLNGANPDAVIRVDVNFLEASDTRGCQIWLPSNHSKQVACQKLAGAILSAYRSGTEMPERLFGTSATRAFSDKEIFNAVTAPIVCLIMGHISNSSDDKLLNDADFQQRIATSILEGLVSYFG